MGLYFPDIVKPEDWPDHPDYAAARARWKRCRDFVEGEEAVRAGGYVPRLRQQSDDDYESYVKRAPFWDAVARTVTALNGLIYNRSVTIEGSPSTERLADTLGLGEGQDVYTVAAAVAEEVLTTTRAVVVVDLPRSGTPPVPFAAVYRAEDLVSWETADVGGREVLTYAVLEEVRSVRENLTVAKQRYRRVYQLQADEAEGGEVRARFGLYKFVVRETPEGDRTEEWVREDEGQLEASGGRPLSRLPVIVHNGASLRPKPRRPMLMGLVDIVHKWYMKSADLAQAEHLVCLPTLVVIGDDTEDNGRPRSYYLGSDRALTFPNPETKIEFVEVSGGGLARVAGSMEALEKQAVALVGRILEGKPAVEESGLAKRLRDEGMETSMVMVAAAVSETMTAVLRAAADWVNVPDPVASYEVTYDVDAAALDAAMLASLLNLRVGGEISRATMFHNLKRGGIVPEDRTYEEEQALIDADAPGLPSRRPGDPGDPGAGQRGDDRPSPRQDPADPQGPPAPSPGG